MDWIVIGLDCDWIRFATGFPGDAAGDAGAFG